jgi:hypothetical protein
VPLYEPDITLTSSRESSSSSLTDFRVDDRGGGSGSEHQSFQTTHSEGHTICLIVRRDCAVIIHVSLDIVLQVELCVDAIVVFVVFLL